MLPNGFEIIEEGNKLFIKYGGVYIVTHATGSRKHVKGTDDKARARIAKWAWQYFEGGHIKYRRAMPGENVL